MRDSRFSIIKALNIYIVMDRVWKSRGRAGSGFGQSGSGRVFAYFESRVQVLDSQVLGFCRVSNSTMK